MYGMLSKLPEKPKAVSLPSVSAITDHTCISLLHVVTLGSTTKNAKSSAETVLEQVEYPLSTHELNSNQVIETLRIRGIG